MKNYQEITLLPTPEISSYFLWGKIFQQLHLAFVEHQNEEKKVAFGLSFPQYSEEHPNLGYKLRVFACDEADLERLNLSDWLDRLSDYMHLTKPRQVPEKVKYYATYKRVQVKSSIERLARRKARRQNLTYEEALSQLRKMKPQMTRLPFVQFKSLSSQHHFKLFIQKQCTDTAQSGLFSSYGLSSQVTVPEF